MHTLVCFGLNARGRRLVPFCFCYITTLKFQSWTFPPVGWILLHIQSPSIVKVVWESFLRKIWKWRCKIGSFGVISIHDISMVYLFVPLNTLVSYKIVWISFLLWICYDLCLIKLKYMYTICGWEFPRFFVSYYREVSSVYSKQSCQIPWNEYLGSCSVSWSLRKGEANYFTQWLR